MAFFSSNFSNVYPNIWSLVNLIDHSLAFLLNFFYIFLWFWLHLVSHSDIYWLFIISDSLTAWSTLIYLYPQNFSKYDVGRTNFLYKIVFFLYSHAWLIWCFIVIITKRNCKQRKTTKKKEGGKQNSHCGREVEYGNGFLACHMRRLKGCTDGSASTPRNLYQDAGPKRCQHSQNSRAQSPLNPFYTWCNILLTELHHSSVVSIPLLLPSNSSIFPLQLPPLFHSLMCTRVRGNHHHHYA